MNAMKSDFRQPDHSWKGESRGTLRLMKWLVLIALVVLVLLALFLPDRGLTGI